MLGLVYIFLNDAKNDTYLLELLQCYVKMSIEEINLVVLLSSWDTMSVSLTRNKFSMYLFAFVFSDIWKDPNNSGGIFQIPTVLQVQEKVQENVTKPDKKINWQNSCVSFHEEWDLMI